jgi:hypothetical protein
MMTSIGFYLSGVIAAGIIFVGCRFLLALSTAAAAYSVPAGAEPHSRAYLSAKGIRDIASGLFTVMPIVYGSAHALGWFMLVATLIPITDAVIVLHQGGSKTIALGVHGVTFDRLAGFGKARRNRKYRRP